MNVDYCKLWTLLEFNQLNKREFQKMIAISAPTMTKLNRNETVSMDVMLRICKLLHCDIGDVMEVYE